MSNESLIGDIVVAGVGIAVIDRLVSGSPRRKRKRRNRRYVV